MQRSLTSDERLNLVRSVASTLQTLEGDLSDLGAHSEANHIREVYDHISEWTVRSVLLGRPRKQKEYEGPETISDLLD